MAITTVPPSIATSVSIHRVTTIYKNTNNIPVYTHYKADKSLSTGEATAVILCYTVFLVRVMITILSLLRFGFKFKKNDLQTTNLAHTTQLREPYILQCSVHTQDSRNYVDDHDYPKINNVASAHHYGYMYVLVIL